MKICGKNTIKCAVEKSGDHSSGSPLAMTDSYGLNEENGSEDGFVGIDLPTYERNGDS